MDRNFERALSAVLKHEGGFVDHPKDPGGATNKGVTLANFRAFVKPSGTVDDLKKITTAQAGTVYRRHYWDKVMASDLPDGVDYAVFDFAVNSGPSRATKFLQAIVGVPQDGVIGPKTIAAAKAVPAATLIDKYCDKRLSFLKRLSTFATFGKGWTSRVKGVRELAKQLAQQPPEAARVVVEETVVAPKGADKTLMQRIAAGGAIAAPVAPFFLDFDQTGKLLMLGIGLVAVVVMLWRGELIAARVRKVLSAFDGEKSA